MYLCAKDIDFVSFYEFRLNFRIVPTVWYFLFFHFIMTYIPIWVRIRVMVFNATFNNISLYIGCQFYWWRKQEYPEKTTNLSLVTCLTNTINILSEDINKND